MRLRPVIITGTITYAGADPDHPGKGLVIERRSRSGLTYHRLDTPRDAIAVQLHHTHGTDDAA